uniref:AMP phosphorylase n=1 Tax=Staphylothermus marinus TaxID=2280 RepID=A0A7C4DAI4_STAMA
MVLNLNRNVESRYFTVETIDIDFGRLTVIMNENDARELGLNSNSRVKLIKGDRSISATVALTKTVVERGKILVSPDVAYLLKLSKVDELGIKPLPVISSLITLHKRIRGERLTQDETYRFVKDVVEGSLSEAEIATFLVSQMFYELSEDELYNLIVAMVETGSKISFEERVYDIHSIGGVPGNGKVALISVPTIAAAGLLIPKTSSRAITSAAGTADIMEVLANVCFTAEELKEIARKVRAALVWGGKLNLAPADDIFVNVERKLGIDPKHQMVASILAKKVAMSVDNLVIDIPVGKKIKVETINEADELAGLFIRQAGRLGINIKVTVTYGGQPIGETIGPALEAYEALKSMIDRTGRRSLIDKALHIAGLVLELSGKTGLGEGYILAREIFTSGRTYEKFKQIIEAQGGDPNIKPEDIAIGKHSFTIYSPLEGAVTHIDNASVLMIARAAGAPFDKGAGVRLHAKVGYRVNKGDPLITIYSNSSSRLEEAVSIASNHPPVIVEGMILKILP